jgi:hypothetical protein
LAATDLAGGRAVAIKPVPVEITMFLLAKEFHWTCDEIRNSRVKDIKGITTILSTYNRIKNEKIEQQNRKANKRR